MSSIWPCKQCAYYYYDRTRMCIYIYTNTHMHAHIDAYNGILNQCWPPILDVVEKRHKRIETFNLKRCTWTLYAWRSVLWCDGQWGQSGGVVWSAWFWWVASDLFSISIFRQFYFSLLFINLLIQWSIFYNSFINDKHLLFCFMK